MLAPDKQLTWNVLVAPSVPIQVTTEQTARAVAWVRDSGKNLTDTDKTTCLHVPTIGLVVAGDAVYNDVHLYFTKSSNRLRRRPWSAVTAGPATTTTLATSSGLVGMSTISMSWQR